MAGHERHTPAMGSMADVVVVGGPAGLLDRACSRIAELEQRWSRFLPDSEVSRHNAAVAVGDDSPALSPDTLLLMERAAVGFEITNGRFDANRLGAVTAAGYVRSLERYGPPAADQTHHSANAPTTGFDPGGIGKGLAADIVSAEIMSEGATGALVSVGGDLRVRGVAPDGEAWRIDIEDPRDGGVVSTIALLDGAVATSSQLKRQWTDENGLTLHHLIDPATGTVSTSSVLAATVVAAEGWQAEVLAKVAFLDAFGEGALSDDTGFALIESLGAAALVVTEDLVVTTARWEVFELRMATS